MEKYIVGHCIGCGNRTAGAVYCDDDEKNAENALNFIESGHAVRLLITDKPVGVEGCVC